MIHVGTSVTLQVLYCLINCVKQMIFSTVQPMVCVVVYGGYMCEVLNVS